MDRINFTINGEPYSLDGSQVTTNTTLFEYLRYYASLCGTKVMCREGGCGACLVAVSRPHPLTKEAQLIAVNSCLVYVHSCHQWEITTIEGVGDRRKGHHTLQRRLAEFNGTQCGYCSPGMVVNMYSLTEGGKKTLTSQQIENSFGGNMCRCTGYRPILDAFKSFASVADQCLLDKVHDMEDIADVKCKEKCTRKCSLNESDWCVIENHPETSMKVETKSGKWYKVFTVQEVFETLRREGASDYVLINGNTGRGVYPSLELPPLIIDLSSIASLNEVTIDNNLVLGAGMTLAECMNAFKCLAENNEDFKYLEVFRRHLDLVAHVPVRNIGTIGGNLALKNQHKNFPSDIFLLLETVKATVTVVDQYLKKREYRMAEFIQTDLRNSIINDVKLPPLSASHLVMTYKIMPRAQNAHAIMNAGFLFKLDINRKVVESNIVYGAVSANFVHAKGTEDVLKGQSLFENETLQKALAKLNDEIVPTEMCGEPSPYTKKMIALGLFYKALLNLAPSDQVDDRYKSGGNIFDRPVSKGSQIFETDKTVWPLNQPIPKIEALAQCSGEAQYTDDVDVSSREVHVAPVLSTIFKGEIDVIDATDALKIPGVVAVLTAKDIPGKNSFGIPNIIQNDTDEEILCSNKVLYHGQVLALVAAKTRQLAIIAAKEVKVTYKNVSENKPVITIRDALNAPDAKNRFRDEGIVEPTDRGTDTTKVVKGSYFVPSQYHYYMEPQTCRASVSEFGVDIVAATQWVDLANQTVSKMLGIDENKVNITVTRLGGAYGGKATRATQFVCACALVAYKLDRPARLVLQLTDNMAAVGKRQDCLADYEVGIDDKGLIQYLDLKYYSNLGCNFNDNITGSIGPTMAGYFDSARWKIQGYSVLTDIAANTWCRAPGTTEAAAIIEHIMERISFATKLDPTEVRILNMGSKHDQLKSMIQSFKKDSEFDKRRMDIEKFNKDNAWRKRSIRLISMAFPLAFVGNFPATISVYHGDGSVAVSHAGIEMGQGINTKVAQVCAHTLKIALDKITVKPATNFISPNALATSSSITSEAVAFSTIKACEELLKRLRPVVDELNEPTWEETIKKAYDKGVNLQASYMFSDNDNVKEYTIYGVTIAEVELDTLTGRHEILRVDLLEDTGQSISPEIDIGQIEGAFLMGVGMWTSETLVHDPQTGRLITDRTWTYKPPGAKDIPQDMRIVFSKNTADNTRVVRSKATGEPALLMSVVVTHALHDAILQARKQFGYIDTKWLDIGTPYNMQNIISALSPKIKMYKFKN